MRKPIKLKGETEDDYYNRACRLLYSGGCSINEIATKMKISNTEAFNYTHDNIHFITNDECHIINKMHKDGTSIEKIAKTIGVAEDTIRSRINNDSIPYDSFENGNRISDSVLERIKSLYTKGKSIKYIAKKLNLTEHQVRYRLEKCGLYKVAKHNATSSEIKEWKKLYKLGHSLA